MANVKSGIPVGSWLVVGPELYRPGYAILHVFNTLEAAQGFYDAICMGTTEQPQDILLCQVVEAKAVTPAPDPADG